MDIVETIIWISLMMKAAQMTVKTVTMMIQRASPKKTMQEVKVSLQTSLFQSCKKRWSKMGFKTGQASQLQLKLSESNQSMRHLSLIRRT